MPMHGGRGRRNDAAVRRAKLRTRAFDAIRTKMDADHRDVMNSIQKLNDRVAPVAEACAANSQAIRILLKEPTA